MAVRSASAVRGLLKYGRKHFKENPMFPHHWHHSFLDYIVMKCIMCSTPNIDIFWPQFFLFALLPNGKQGLDTVSATMNVRKRSALSLKKHYSFELLFMVFMVMLNTCVSSAVNTCFILTKLSVGVGITTCQMSNSLNSLSVTDGFYKRGEKKILLLDLQLNRC